MLCSKQPVFLATEPLSHFALQPNQCTQWFRLTFQAHPVLTTLS